MKKLNYISVLIVLLFSKNLNAQMDEFLDNSFNTNGKNITSFESNDNSASAVVILKIKPDKYGIQFRTCPVFYR